MQNEKLAKSLEERLDRIQAEEVHVAERMTELDLLDKSVTQRSAQVE